MVELIEALGAMASEAEHMGKMTAVGVLLVISKYAVDILRARIVQRMLAGLEKRAKLPMGSLQWSAWSDRTRVLVSMGQSFLIGLLGALAAGMQTMQAVGAGFVAAVGAKGLHDTGVAPGKRPSARGPAVVIDRKPHEASPSRDLSLKVDLETGRVGDAPGAPKN